MKKKYPSKTKVRKMLKEGTAHGRPLTAAQKRLLGLLAGGGTPTKIKSRKKK